MKHKQFLITVLFVFFSCTLAAAQTRRIEAKNKPRETNGSAMNNPELVFNAGQTGFLQTICYSPDGKYIASGADDKTIKIREVETGREVRTLVGHEASVVNVVYSPDGKYIASGSTDFIVKIWEMASGKCIKTLTEQYYKSICYSPDGRYLVTCNGTINIWEIATGKCIKTLYDENFNCVVAYSPDGAYLATNTYRHLDDGSVEGSIKIWDVITSECIKIISEYTEEIESITYSPNGKYIAICSRKNDTIKLLEIASGRCIKTLYDENFSGVVVYSPDGAYLATNTFRHLDYDSGEGIIKIWDVASGECIRTLTGHTDTVTSVCYSPDGKYLASSSWDKTIKFWEVATGKCIKIMGTYVECVPSVVYSPDGKYIASSFEDRLKLLEASTGKIIKILDEHEKIIEYVCYSPDGKYITSSSLDDTIKLWDVVSGECIRTLTGHTDRITSVCFSPDGKCLASSYWDDTIKIWNIANGECIRTLTGHTDTVTSVCYSPAGNYMASGSWDKTIKLWEVATGKCIKTLNGHTGSVYSVWYSPDGTYLVSGSLDDTIKLWNIANGECIKTLTGHTDAVVSVTYSPDGKYVASTSGDKTIKIWNIANGECIKTLTGHTDAVVSVTYSPDGKYLVSGSWDGTIKFWNAGTGDLIATTFNLKDDEWLTYTPEGLFAGSEWATKNLVHIVDGMKTIGIDQMYDSLYRPDLVSAKLSGEDISPYAQRVNFASLMQTGSAPVVTFLSLDDEVKERDVTIEFAIENTGGGIGEVNLLLNGKNIRLYENVPSKSGQTLYFSHTVTLQNGENTLELYAKNEAGKVESLRSRKTLNWHGNVKKPNLYVLTVAVNQYRDADLRLRYAVPDAKFIVQGFSNQKKSLYQNVFTFSLFDGDVTKEGIKSSFEKLGSQIQPDDVFVFYIAGHGVTYDEDGDYYYLPSDFRYRNAQDIEKQGISKKDLIHFLTLIKASKTLVLMDTCNSGSFLGGSTRGLSEKTAVDRLTRSTGHATIVASLKSQVAMEGYKGHGIFTYIFVEGLSGKADANNDGFITLQELSGYVEEEVPHRSYEKWGYEQTPMRDLRRQDFPIYTSGNR